MDYIAYDQAKADETRHERTTGQGASRRTWDSGTPVATPEQISDMEAYDRKQADQFNCRHNITL